MKKKTGREGKAPLTFYIDEQLHKKFKLACVEHEQPMTTVIETQIRKWLDRERAQGQ